MDFLAPINVLGFLGNQALDDSDVEQPLRGPPAQTTRGKRLAVKCSRFLGHFSSDQAEATRVRLKITAAAAKSLQSCPTLCDPIDGSPSDSPVSGILQARTLE